MASMSSTSNGLGKKQVRAKYPHLQKSLGEIEDTDTPSEKAKDKMDGVNENEKDDTVMNVDKAHTALQKARKAMYKKYPHLDPSNGKTY